MNDEALPGSGEQEGTSDGGEPGRESEGAPPRDEEQQEAAVVEKIVVALDASPQSVAALRAATELAARLQAEVEGLFVEDMDLFCLCDLPFGREVCACTGEVRGIDTAGMERQLRVQAASIREVMRRVAEGTPVPWSLRVLRGSVAEELLIAAQGAMLMGMGRAGRARGRGMGSIAQALVAQSHRPLLISGEGTGLEFPLTVVYTGTPAAQRALELAMRLAEQDPGRLRVVVWNGGDASADLDQLEHEARRLTEPQGGEDKEPFSVLRAGGQADLVMTLHDLRKGTLVLPHEHADLLSQHSGPTLLVP